MSPLALAGLGRPLATIAGAIGIFVAGTIAGGRWVGNDLRADIADLKADHALAAAVSERDARQRLQAAQALGDTLTVRLANAEAARMRDHQERSREISRLTSGRACLGGTVVRLLNTGPGLVVPRAGLPAPAGSAAAADAAFATDTDVGLWIDGARKQYDTCRDRVQALIDFHHPLTERVEP